MWRYLPSISQPEPKAKQSTAEKRKYFSEYDKVKRARQFQEKWRKDRTWLVLDDDGMKCSVCMKYSSGKSSDGKISVFITGCSSMKLESVIKHEESNLHKKCMAVDEAKKKPVLDTQAAKVVRILNVENFKKSQNHNEHEITSVSAVVSSVSEDTEIVVEDSPVDNPESDETNAELNEPYKYYSSENNSDSDNGSDIDSDLEEDNV